MNDERRPAVLVRPTMREVAKRAGVSISTVSRVMSDHPDVSADTRERVQTAIQDLDYRRSMLARGLILKRTNSLGLLVSDITNPFYPQLALGIEDKASEAGWVLIMSNTERDGQRLDSYVDAMLERAVDGMIFGSVMVGDEIVPRLVESGYPVVLVNRRHPDVETNMVIVDNVRGAALAAEHLHSLGHRRVAHIAGPAWATNALDRRSGFLETMRRLGAPVSDDLVVEGDFSLEGGAAAMKQLLESAEPPTAVFATNDLMALGAMEALLEAGLSCPEDVSIVGFDDIELSRSKLIELTTVSHRIYEMGSRSVEILLQVIHDGSPTTPIREFLQPRLVVRRTTAELPH